MANEDAELREVVKLASELVTIRDTSEILARVLEAMARFGQAERGYIVRVKGERTSVSAVFPGGGGAEVGRMNRGAIDRALKEKKTVASGEGAKAALCVPMVFRETPVGVVYLYRPKGDGFEKASASLLETLAGYAAAALANADLSEHGATDPVTGLYSHRYFESCVARELERCARTVKPLSVILLDIDDFKAINEKHAIGEALIRELSVIVSTLVRRTDIIAYVDGAQVSETAAARYEGDEFAVMLADAPKAGARNVAERLSAVVTSMPFEFGKTSVPVSISAGVATFPEDAKDAESLLARADEALLEAKKKGQGHVFTF